MSRSDDTNLDGMTVNERLCYLGTLADWDDAAKRRDREAMIAVLEWARVNEPPEVADAVLADPRRYGL